MTPKLDGRSQADIAQRLLRDAAALLGHNGEPVEPGRIGGAIIASAARLFEEVTRRLDRAPDKQADNFYTAMGLGRDPAQPAGVPVAAGRGFGIGFPRTTRFEKRHCRLRQPTATLPVRTPRPGSSLRSTLPIGLLGSSSRSTTRRGTL
jgi:hypothetical protein